MTWVFVGLVVVVVAAVAAVAVGHGDGLAVAPSDRREVAVPADRPLTAADLAGVGFSVGLRGYRMDEVDDLLARLGADLTERDRRLAAGPQASPLDDPGRSDSAEPDTAEPDTAEPDTAEIGTSEPGTAEIGRDEPGTSERDSVEPEDASASDGDRSADADDRPPTLRGFQPGGSVPAAGEPAARR